VARAVSGPVEFGAAKPVAGDDPGSFRFLNVARSFPGGSVDWTCADMPKLWRYNLHYFDYLHEPGRSFQQKAQLIDDWIRHNPPGTADAWEPYTASLRIANWAKYFMSLPARAAPSSGWLASLWSQCAWLRQNIEYHLLANHLFKNAKALLFAGVFFDDPAASEWLDKGEQILIEQLEEQFLADGGHFERSPMYHAITVEDLLDLIALDQAFPNVMPAALVAALTGTAHRALDFLRDLTLADGEIALFNDAAHGIAAPTWELLVYAARLPQIHAIRPRTQGALVERAASGYYGWSGLRDGWLLDCGPVGPDYQPGHAHCDTLSYELVLDGRRIVVDTGVHDYEPGDRRYRSRSTASHNTVMVDGAEQSEIWGVFRVGRRARAIEAELTNRAGVVSFVGAHDGYCGHPGGVIHRRKAEYRPDHSLEVADELTGNGRHGMDNRIHFAPALRICGHGRSLEIHDGSNVPVARLDIAAGPDIHVEAAEQYPEFGRTERTAVVRLHSAGALPLRQHYIITRI
jgi:uncharacterized heparinase superfamily protein